MIKLILFQKKKILVVLFYKLYKKIIFVYKLVIIYRNNYIKY